MKPMQYYEASLESPHPLCFGASTLAAVPAANLVKVRFPRENPSPDGSVTPPAIAHLKHTAVRSLSGKERKTLTTDEG